MQSDLVTTIHKCKRIANVYPSTSQINSWGGEAVVAGSAALWYHLHVNLGITPSWTPGDIDLWVPIPDDLGAMYERDKDEGRQFILEFCEEIAGYLDVKDRSTHPLGRYVRGVLDGWPIQIIPCLDNPLTVTDHFDLSPCRISICVWRDNLPVILHPDTSNEDLVAGKMMFYGHEGYDVTCKGAQKRIERYRNRGFTKFEVSEEQATPFQTIGMYQDRTEETLIHEASITMHLDSPVSVT